MAIERIDQVEIQVSRKEVFRLLDCYEDSPVYEEMLEAYEEGLPVLLPMLEPCLLIGEGTLPKALTKGICQPQTQVLFLIGTVGRAISDYCTHRFQEGEYVLAMLADAVADAALMSMEPVIQAEVRKRSAVLHRGVSRRLEAPQDISMESQREAFLQLHAEEQLGMSISSGYMLDPVKSSCQIFLLTEDEVVFEAQHDCSSCSCTDCKFRNRAGRQASPSHVLVREYCGGAKISKLERTEQELMVKPGQTLLAALQELSTSYAALCGGSGRCGKCGVRVTRGAAAITEADRRFYREQELAEGWRLACMLVPQGDLEIEVRPVDGRKIQSLEQLTEPGEQRTEAGGAKEQRADGQEAAFWFAVDIGTTTIAMQLFCGSESLAIASRMNQQRVYGADVIARIQASCEGKGGALKRAVEQDLLEGMEQLCREREITLAQITRIFIACNTTMSHLLLGLDCHGLGMAPFTPVDISWIEKPFSTVFSTAQQESAALVTILPGVSTYVGGDITAGMYACGFADSEEICLLVDFGTNGEVALGNRERILVTSTAAGPAFEGGNISAGTGSIPGAISSVELVDGGCRLRTIQDQPPVGLCGTGVVELTAELVRVELVDETGRMEEPYFDEGYPLAQREDGSWIRFTQKDIREIQLAKAAVYAGMETLMLRYGIQAEEIAHVYLAGGFGFSLDVKKAAAIGLLPKALESRVEAVGNTSLKGAALAGLRGDRKTICTLAKRAEEIGLATDPFFQETYMDAMFFEADTEEL